MIKDKQKATIMKFLQQVINTYHGRGIKFRQILGEIQFECIRKPMEVIVITVNTTAYNKHVPEIERYIRTLKERVRATTSTLPCKQLPHQLIVDIAYKAVFWLNCFSHKNGIHSKLIPPTIVTGSKVDFNKNCRLQFRTYLKFHKQHNN